MFVSMTNFCGHKLGLRKKITTNSLPCAVQTLISVRLDRILCLLCIYVVYSNIIITLHQQVISSYQDLKSHVSNIYTSSKLSLIIDFVVTKYLLLQIKGQCQQGVCSYLKLCIQNTNKGLHIYKLKTKRSLGPVRDSGRLLVTETKKKGQPQYNIKDRMKLI